MLVAVVGATGGSGSAVVDVARSRGHRVRAYVRPGSRATFPSDVEVVTGELDDRAALRRLVSGADAVVSALGARTNTSDQPAVFERALTSLTEVLREVGPRRLVSIAGAALILPDDRPTFGRRLASTVLGCLARHVLAAKQAEARVVLASDLDWTLVRPGRMVPGGPTGGVQVDLRDLPAFSATYGDVASVIVDAATSDAWIRTAPFVGTPRRA